MSRTVLLCTGQLLCPRYAATFKDGHGSMGSLGCFGRLPPTGIINTVFTRPEPHNLCIVDPTQDRVLTPRNNARFQVQGHTRLVSPACLRHLGVNVRYEFDLKLSVILEEGAAAVIPSVMHLTCHLLDAASP